MRRSYRYFKRTIKNVVYYKEAISELIRGIKNKGYTGIVLVGQSDLDFIVEHFCVKYGLKWITDEAEEGEPGVFYLYSESYLPDEEVSKGEGMDFLQRLFV